MKKCSRCDLTTCPFSHQRPVGRGEVSVEKPWKLGRLPPAATALELHRLDTPISLIDADRFGWSCVEADVQGGAGTGKAKTSESDYDPGLLTPSNWVRFRRDDGSDRSLESVLITGSGSGG